MKTKNNSNLTSVEFKWTRESKKLCDLLLLLDIISQKDQITFILDLEFYWKSRAMTNKSYAVHLVVFLQRLGILEKHCGVFYANSILNRIE